MQEEPESAARDSESGELSTTHKHDFLYYFLGSSVFGQFGRPVSVARIMVLISSRKFRADVQKSFGAARGPREAVRVWMVVAIL